MSVRVGCLGIVPPLSWVSQQPDRTHIARIERGAMVHAVRAVSYLLYSAAHWPTEQWVHPMRDGQGDINMIANITYSLLPSLDSGALATFGSSLVLAMVLVFPLFLMHLQRTTRVDQWVRIMGMASEQLMPAPGTLQNGLTARQLLELQLREPCRSGHRKAMLVIGVDGFSVINQLYGHGFGDELLKAIAVRLHSSIRMGNLAVRLAGDEFAVIAQVEAPEQAKAIAKRLMQEMQRPFVINGTSVDVSASIGISVECAEDGQRSRLLTQATAALAEAKDLGRNRYTVFNVLMGASVSEVELMVGDLRRGLRENEFYLVYQPKLGMQSGRLIGMEALLRWNHPEHGQVAPDHFVPLAEKTGMIVDIGRWVLNEACRQMQVWRSEHVIDWRVSVNASVFQLNAASFYGDVLDALERNALDPEDLCIEITESEAMRNAELSLMTLHRLSAAGVRISLDDFGVGHSSLSHLKRFPVQELKIDRSFISGIAECPESEAIVRAIIGLAKAVGLQVVAEGVETEEQQALLAEMDCDVIQGYLISRPVRPEDVSALVTRYNATHGVLNRLLES